MNAFIGGEPLSVKPSHMLRKNKWNTVYVKKATDTKAFRPIQVHYIIKKNNHLRFDSRGTDERVRRPWREAVRLMNDLDRAD